MISMKRSLLISVMAFCSFSACARDAYIYFAHFPCMSTSQKHSYTITFGGESKGMYGVYNPGKAHLSKYVADVNLDRHTPPDYVRVHWKSSTHESYQDFFVTDDDNPAIKFRFRWYKPYSRAAYITIFGDLANHALYFQNLWRPHANDTLLYML